MGVCISKTKDFAEDVKDNIDEIQDLGNDISDTVDSIVDDKPISEVIDNIKEVGENTVDLVTKN